jgi:signal transduction histidine kinase
LSLVFQNLLSNSLKYAHPERKLRIRIWSTESAKFQRIHFADNGIGFEPEFSERIFGLFKRLHGREVPGTGLGLAICRRIIEAQGGQIRAEGVAKRGATFIFSLKGTDDHGAGYADIAGRGQPG